MQACITDGLTCKLVAHSQHDGAVPKLEEAVGVLGLQELVLGGSQPLQH